MTPSEKMARVSTVAVVVPSPAMSFVFEATCFTSAAPMFTNLHKQTPRYKIRFGHTAAPYESL